MNPKARMVLGAVLRSGVRLVVLGKEGDGVTLLASTAGTSDAVDVILNGQRELQSLVSYRVKGHRG